MADSKLNPVVIVPSEAELASADKVWGTGGWQQPEEREALDWLTLARLLGWSVTVTTRPDAGLDGGPGSGKRLIVFACDPDSLSEETIALLTSWLALEPILVVARAGDAKGAFADLAGTALQREMIKGRSLRWIGPGSERRWACRRELEANALKLAKETLIWSTLDGGPIIAARPFGRGVIATLGFHASQARDRDGSATALLKHLLVWGSTAPVAWFDLEGCLVLRMDDPGGAQNIYSRSWPYPKLGEAQWNAIGTDLRRRNARLSIGYVSGWVDDGDAARGALQVAGLTPDRRPGQVYPSPLVHYRDLAGHAPGTSYDYQAEFRGINALRAKGLADVELHGYTHMHPDSVAWAQAADRYETWPATSWYRELGRTAETTIANRPADEHPLSLGVSALRRYFNVHPTTLICPGDQWSNTALERALELDLKLVSSYYLAIRDGGRFCWTRHVCAPYLDKPDSAWFDSGLPVVGYFHDREVALEGVEWMTKWFDLWQDAGANKFMDFRELASTVGRRLHLQEHNGELHLTIRSNGVPALVRPLNIAIRSPGRRLPCHISANFDGREVSLSICHDGEGLGRLTLPISLLTPRDQNCTAPMSLAT